MTAVAFKIALTKQLPILFAYIGWAENYDSTKPIDGNFGWLKDNPNKNWEAEAFLKDDDGYFYCGAGFGKISPATPMHMVFVSRDTVDKKMKVVGIYAAAKSVPTKSNWPRVRTKMRSF